eukprot:TRINITY_DN12679_c0_g1_i1.p1 TRINITY_DN12679_c0_g1~~TRINITY_DN12679_c0_g1_i1.p1  ORF type:complete len:181 (-),score=37.32 TRINITY_DN12679_c0_g1_i1:266-808(-)
MIRRPPRSTLSSSSAASDVYKRQEYGVTPLIMEVNANTAWLLDAAMKNQMDQLEAIAERGVPLSLRGDWGESAPHVAAGKGCMEALEFLYGHEPDCLEWDDNNQKTVCHYAARNNHLSVVEWIYERKPDCNQARDYKGRTPADLCREVNRADCDTIYFLEHGMQKPSAPAPAPAAVYHSS